MTRKNPIKLKEAKRLQWGATEPTVKDIFGGWHKRQGVRMLRAERHPPSDETWIWLNEKFPASGYRIPGLREDIDHGILGHAFYTGPRRALMGKGVWGYAFRLETVNGNPSGLMLKLTGDPGEVAAAHRLAGSTSPALPEVEGAWGIPGGWWIIVREDVIDTCVSLGRSRDLCTALDVIGLELRKRARRPDHLINFNPEKWGLNHQERRMIGRFVQQLQDVQRQTGVTFTDLNSDNIRIRDRGGRKELVVTDFGLSTGPAVSVPIAQNPRVRMRGRENPMSERKSLKTQYRAKFGSDWWKNPTIKDCLRARLSVQQCAQRLAGPKQFKPSGKATKPRLPSKPRQSNKRVSTITVGGDTSEGPRHGNEDAFLAKLPVIIVSDGMGGHAAGEVASAITVETIEGVMRADSSPTALPKAIKEANERVISYGRTHLDARGLGCTVTAGFIQGNDMYLGHVGDTRCTLVYDNKITQLTSDHNVPGDLVARGIISREAAKSHPQGNMLTRAIGSNPRLDVDTFRVPLRDGQVFLFTSDGVHDYIPDPQVLRIVRNGGSAKTIAKNLVTAALSNATHDNCTAVVVKVGGSEARKNPRSRKNRVSDEWLITDVNPPDLQRAVGALRRSGLGVQVRETTEGRKRAIGLRLILPKGAEFFTDEQSKVIGRELPWIGTLIGHTSRDTKPRPWIDEEIKRREAQREAYERAVAQPPPYRRPRGKHPSKPKGKRSWRHRNPR